MKTLDQLHALSQAWHKLHDRLDVERAALARLEASGGGNWRRLRATVRQREKIESLQARLTVIENLMEKT